jgi:Holliday junction resolvasome, helicase subunit
MTDTHITDPSIIEDDITIEKTLRPSHFDDFVGQNDVVDNLKLYIDAANKREEALDHVLLFGPPGKEKQPWPTLYQKS